MRSIVRVSGFRNNQPFPVARRCTILATSTGVDVEVASVSLTVRDLAGATAFYRDAIGLEQIKAGAGTVDMGVAGRAFLTLRHRPDATPDDPSEAGLFHLAVLLPSRADLGGWLTHAQARGIRIGGSADHLVSEAFYLADPEGNGVEVYADRPGGRMALDTDGRRAPRPNGECAHRQSGPATGRSPVGRCPPPARGSATSTFGWVTSRRPIGSTGVCWGLTSRQAAPAPPSCRATATTITSPPTSGIVPVPARAIRTGPGCPG